ncbi:MAG: transcriptional regulator [Kofleriaceae bacterium]
MARPGRVSKQGQLARLIALNNVLTESRRGINVRQYAAATGVAVRTIYRDLKTLEQAGFPISEDEGRYFLPASFTRLRTPGVEPDELLALFLARQTAKVLRGTSAGAALDRLWSKLSANGTGQPALAPAASAPVHVGPWFGIDYRPHLHTIDVLEQGIGRRLAVRARYRSPRASAATARVIEPGDLFAEPGSGTLYVVSYCQLREGIRVFAVHRFLEVELTDQAIVPRAETRSQNALKHAFRVWHADTAHTVRLRFSPALAPEIRERRWHKSQRVTELVEGGLVLEMTLAEPLELVRWLLGFGPDVTVLEPSNLAARVADLHLAAATPALRGRKGLNQKGNLWRSNRTSRRTP